MEEDQEELVAHTIMQSKQLCYEVTLNVKEVQAIYLRLANQSNAIKTNTE